MNWGPIILKNTVGIVRLALSPLKRIYEENQAARGGRRVKIDALDSQFEISYGHLLHSRPGDESFSPIAANAIQEIISTSQLQSADMQIWLNKPDVRKYFFALATAYIVNPNGYINDKKKAFNALRKTFPDAALQEGEKFEDIARKICSVLTSGPVANLTSGERVLLGVAQKNAGAVEQVQGTLDGYLDTKDKAQVYDDSLVKDRLDHIVASRAIPGANEKEDIADLADKISDTGDWQHCSVDMKAAVLYWAARIHAAKGDSEAVKAKGYLSKLLKIRPDHDVRLINAFLLKWDGKKEEAIKLLNEVNSPDSRTILGSILSTENRIEWYKTNKDKVTDPFTGRGWANLIISFIEQNAWEEGYKTIPQVPPKAFEEFCDLHYVVGLMHTGFLLPQDLRSAILTGGGFCPDIAIAADHDSRVIWKHAVEHLEKAKTIFEKIGLEGRALYAKCWIAWLHYKNPETKDQGLAMIQSGLSNSEEFFQFLQIAITNDVPFDLDQQKDLLQNREITGVFGGQDYLAKMFLLHRERDFQGVIKLLDNSKSILVPDFLEETMWAFHKINAHVELEQFPQAENLLFEHREAFGEDFPQIQDKIRAAKGEDIQESLIQRYEEGKQDIDLINLCNTLYRQGDLSLLEKYSQELFDRHKTTENAGRYIITLWRLEKYQELVDFVGKHLSEASGDIRLISHYAWSLHHVGKFKEASEVCQKYFSNQTEIDVTSLKINLALFSGDWEKFPEILNIEKQEAQNRSAIHILQTAPILADYDLDAANR